MTATVKLPDRFSPNTASYCLDSDPAGIDALEWAKAWAALKRQRSRPGDDFAEECDATGEVWQYMSTETECNSLGTFTGRTLHQFRHRCAGPIDSETPTHHAPDHARRYVNIDASPDFAARMRAEIAAVRRRCPSVDLSIPPEGDEA